MVRRRLRCLRTLVAVEPQEVLGARDSVLNVSNPTLRLRHRREELHQILHRVRESIN